MDDAKLDKEIAGWTESLHYHLFNYHNARQNGSFNSAENSQTKAAEAAAIITALKGMRTQNDEG